MGRQLYTEDTFPEYSVRFVDGRTLRIPGDLKGEYAVLLFYRGIW